MATSEESDDSDNNLRENRKRSDHSAGSLVSEPELREVSAEKRVKSRPGRAKNYYELREVESRDVSDQKIDYRVDIGLDINSNIAVACIMHNPSEDELSKQKNNIFDPKQQDDEVNALSMPRI